MNDLFYAADISPLLTDAALYRRAYDAAAPQKREALDRIRVTRERCLSLCGALLLQKALRDVGAEPPLFACGENGKPFLKNSPGLHFNISHSGDFAVCVLSDAPVGCDVETIRPVRDAVAERCFSAEENAALAAQDGAAAKETLFFRYWTLKESFLKAVGCGITVPLSSVSFDLSGDAPAVRQSISDGRFFFREYGDLPGYRAALCKTAEIQIEPVIKLIPWADVLPEGTQGISDRNRM